MSSKQPLCGFFHKFSLFLVVSLCLLHCTVRELSVEDSDPGFTQYTEHEITVNLLLLI